MRKRGCSVADGGDLRPQLLHAEAAGDRGRARMIGHDDVLVAARLGRGHQRLERVAAVGPVGVRVQVAANVAGRDQGRQPALARGLDLALVLAQLGRDPGQAHRGVDLLLGGAGHALAGALVEHAVLADPQSSAGGDLAHAHVVILGAGEVLQGGAEGGGLDDAQIDLQAVLVTDRGLGRPLHDHLGHRRQRGQRPDHALGLGGRHQQVDVLHRLAHAPQRARDLQPLDAAVRAQGLGDLRGHRPPAGQERARLAGLPALDGLEDVLGCLVADAGHPDDLAASGTSPRAAPPTPPPDRRGRARCAARARGSRGRSGTRRAGWRGARPAARSVRWPGTRRCGPRGHARCRAGR